MFRRRTPAHTYRRSGDGYRPPPWPEGKPLPPPKNPGPANSAPPPSAGDIPAWDHAWDAPLPVEDRLRDLELAVAHLGYNVPADPAYPDRIAAYRRVMGRAGR